MPIRDRRHSLAYKLYMASDEWFWKKCEKIASVGFRCENCAEPYGIDVHHLHYRNLGHEPLSDLVVLCHICHRNEHRGAA